MHWHSAYKTHVLEMLCFSPIVSVLTEIMCGSSLLGLLRRNECQNQKQNASLVLK